MRRASVGGGVRVVAFPAPDGAIGDADCSGERGNGQPAPPAIAPESGWRTAALTAQDLWYLTATWSTYRTADGDARVRRRPVDPVWELLCWRVAGTPNRATMRTLMREGGPYAELFELQAAGYARGPARASSGCRQPVQLRDPFRTPPDGSQGVGQRGRDRARSRCRSTSSGPGCEWARAPAGAARSVARPASPMP